MIKLVLKRIFALVGSALAPLVAIMYLIAGVQAVISIGNDVKTNFFLIIAFVLLFALAFGLTFFGGKVLFSFLNKEDDDSPFAMLIMCFLYVSGAGTRLIGYCLSSRLPRRYYSLFIFWEFKQLGTQTLSASESA